MAPSRISLAGTALWCMFLAAQAGASVLALEAGGGRWDASSYAEYLPESGGPWMPEMLDRPPLTGQFARVAAPTVNLGLRNDVCWLRFSLRNPAPYARTFYIELDNALLGKVECYTPNGSGGFKVERAGTRLPYDARRIPHPCPTFPLTLGPGQDLPVSLRVTNRGWFLFSVLVWSEEAFGLRRTHYNLGLGFLYGALMIAAAQSVLTYLRLRDRRFLQNFLFVMSCLFYELSFHGTTHAYLWPHATWWADRSVVFFLGLATALAFALCRAFLGTSETAPLWDKILKVLIAVSVAVAVGRLTSSIWVNRAADFVYAAGPVTILAAALVCWHRGQRPALLLLLAWGVMLSGAALYALMGVGLAPRGFLTQNTMHIGIGVAPLLFTLALADRVRLLEMQYRGTLELQVAERTRALREALDKVKTLRGLIPICAGCKKIRNDRGYWDSIETYLHSHSDAEFTHGLCPECLRRIYGKEIDELLRNGEKQG